MEHVSIGLRARLLLLVLFAVVPAFALIGYTAVVQHQQAAVRAERDALTLVRLATREQAQLIAATRQLLASLTQFPAVRQRDSGVCRRVLAEVLKAYPYYTNLGVARPDGNVFCSAVPLTRPVNISDRTYFRRAVATGDFGVGDYQVGRITGINAINFGYPVTGERGQVLAVVYTALNLSWLNRLVAEIELPAGSTVTVVDSRGTVLARHPEPERWMGKSMTTSPLFSAIVAGGGDGTGEFPGLDGLDRLYAFAPLYAGPSGNVYVGVGIPKAVAFAGARADLARNFGLLFLVAVLALAAAWFGGDVFVLRQVRALAVAARRLARGDLDARTGLSYGNEELGRLARDFDEMAAGLQKVNRALRTLSAGNKTLVRAKDERTLLAEMCRIMVELGGYRLAWIGYAEQGGTEAVRPVVEYGFEGGVEALASVQGAITWADAKLGRGPAAAAIRSGKPCILRNLPGDPRFAPWREQARRQGYASVAAFPLRAGKDVIGALSIYAREPDAFDDEDLELLGEAAEDLAYGITALRTRGEHERAHETIAHMAYFDGLTGLPNHLHLDERLGSALAESRAKGSPLALLLLDLDRFREINDALGFHQGDLLLKDVAERIRGTVPDGATAARMRGDEFAILMPGGDAAAANATAQRVLEELETPFLVGDLALDVRAAIGIALSPQHGTDVATLSRNADAAMRQAKKSGQGQAVYAPAESEDSTHRLVLARELRRAIEEGGLVLYYQPKLDMRDGSVCGAEALVRWVHPERGMIAPDEFIPLAEHTGLIKPLTDWVLHDVLRQSFVWRQSGLILPIAANLSVRNLRDTELLPKLERMFAGRGADASWLELEITESAVMEDPEGALETLRRLREKGVKLFIDDFGTGYSSLSYLKKLPVKAVKIDKSFVIDMLSSVDSKAIVKSTIGLAHDLGLKVVAEGVENQAMWDVLAALGCDVAQGYFIAKPLPAEQFAQWCAGHAKAQR